MTINISAAKLDAVIPECDRWITRPSMTRRALQPLLRCLAHVASCVPQARRFMSRLLASLRGLHVPHGHGEAGGYFTLMRQSNLLYPALGGWGGPHTIRRRDVAAMPDGLRVTLMSLKTLKSRAQALFVPAISSSPYCPVAAWEKALQLMLAAPDAPAFLVGPRVPLTTRELTSTHQEALGAAGVPNASCHTLHGLCQEPPRPARRRAWPSAP